MNPTKEKILQYHLHKDSPKKLQFELYGLNRYRRKNGIKAAIPHSHSYYQIIWFTKKGGTHLVDFKTYPVTENSILFIGKNQIHAFDDDMDIEGWLFHFNESFFTPADVDAVLKYNIFKPQENPCYAAQAHAIAQAKKYLDLIQDELSNRNRFGFEENVRFLLKSFLINLERVHRTGNDSEELEISNPQKLQAYNFKASVEENYSNHLTVADYASELNISTKTLNNLVRKQFSKSPSEVINERIMLQANRLLKYSTLQISEIAYKLGFSDPSYFDKYFKRYMGVSPNSHREFLKK